MRAYLILIIMAIATAFVTGYFALSLQSSGSFWLLGAPQVEELKLRFQKVVAPRAVIDFRSLYYLEDHFQVVDPMYTIPQIPLGEGHTNYSDELDCERGRLQSLSEVQAEKFWMWEDFRCGRIRKLPQNYFISPPYMHPSGKSYAFLALKSGKPQFVKNRRFAQIAIPLYHVLELKEIKEFIGGLKGVYSVLGDFSAEELRALVRGENTIMTASYYMIRKQRKSDLSDLSYRVYAKIHLDDFLLKSPYFAKSYNARQSCVYRDGQVCWNFTPGHLFSLAGRSAGVFFVISILIIGLVIWLLLTKLRSDRAEDRRKRLALQVLTHEFRTPIASMMLSVEQLKSKYESLPEETQDLVLRLSDDVSRLKRLTETSRKYMRVQKNKTVVKIDYQKIESLNALLEDIADRYLGKVDLELLRTDKSFRLDPYWFGICLTNLIENAINHGEPPVKVKVDVRGKVLELTVQDAGKSEFQTIEEMTEPFVKNDKSKGSGLGLNIVKEVVADMGGEFIFRFRPTRFIIRLREPI